MHDLVIDHWICRLFIIRRIRASPSTNMFSNHGWFQHKVSKGCRSMRAAILSFRFINCGEWTGLRRGNMPDSRCCTDPFPCCTDTFKAQGWQERRTRFHARLQHIKSIVDKYRGKMYTSIHTVSFDSLYILNTNRTRGLSNLYHITGVGQVKILECSSGNEFRKVIHVKCPSYDAR